MPGMMDTVLNLGLDDAAVVGLARRTGDERFAYDSYRRFIQMFGDIVLKIPHERFEEALGALKEERGVEEDPQLEAADLEELVKVYKGIVEEAPTVRSRKGPKSSSNSRFGRSSARGTMTEP